MRRLYGNGPARENWLRQTMYAHADRYFRDLPAERHRALEISGHFYGDHPWGVNVFLRVRLKPAD